MFETSKLFVRTAFFWVITLRVVEIPC